MEYWFIKLSNIPEWFKITLLSFLVMHVLGFPKKFMALAYSTTDTGWNIIPTQKKN